MLEDLKGMFRLHSAEDLQSMYMLDDVKKFKKRNIRNMLIAFIVVAIISLMAGTGLPGGWIVSLLITGVLIGGYIYPIDLPLGKIMILATLVTLVMSGLNSMFVSDVDKSGLPFIAKIFFAEAGIAVTWFMLFRRDRALLKSDAFKDELKPREIIFLQREYNRALFWGMLVELPLVFFFKTDLSLGDFALTIVFMVMMIIVLRIVDGRVLESIKQSHQETVEMKEQIREQERQMRKRKNLEGKFGKNSED